MVSEAGKLRSYSKSSRTLNIPQDVLLLAQSSAKIRQSDLQSIWTSTKHTIAQALDCLINVLEYQMSQTKLWFFCSTLHQVNLGKHYTGILAIWIEPTRSMFNNMKIWFPMDQWCPCWIKLEIDVEVVVALLLTHTRCPILHIHDMPLLSESREGRWIRRSVSQRSQMPHFIVQYLNWTFWVAFQTCDAVSDVRGAALCLTLEVFFNSSSLQPQSSTLAEGILFKDFAAVAVDVGWEGQCGIHLVSWSPSLLRSLCCDICYDLFCDKLCLIVIDSVCWVWQDAVGPQITLDLTPPNITVSNPASLENQITVVTTLSEAGTVGCSVQPSATTVKIQHDNRLWTCDGTESSELCMFNCVYCNSQN